MDWRTPTVQDWLLHALVRAELRKIQQHRNEQILTGKQSPNMLAYKIMRKARDELKVEYTGVNLKHLQTQPPGKVITGGSPPVRISQASVQRNLFIPSNQESTSVVDCITMPCLIQNVPARGWMEVVFFFFF